MPYGSWGDKKIQIAVRARLDMPKAEKGVIPKALRRLCHVCGGEHYAPTCPARKPVKSEDFYRLRDLCKEAFG